MRPSPEHLMPTDPAWFHEPSVVKPALHWQKLLMHWALNPHSEDVEQSVEEKGNKPGCRGRHLVRSRQGLLVTLRDVEGVRYLQPGVLIQITFTRSEVHQQTSSESLSRKSMGFISPRSKDQHLLLIASWGLLPTPPDLHSTSAVVSLCGCRVLNAFLGTWFSWRNFVFLFSFRAPRYKDANTCSYM
jgi:hypothetical protein